MLWTMLDKDNLIGYLVGRALWNVPPRNPEGLKTWLVKAFEDFENTHPAPEAVAGGANTDPIVLAVSELGNLIWPMQRALAKLKRALPPPACAGNDSPFAVMESGMERLHKLALELRARI
jgi:hypothetical protein